MLWISVVFVFALLPHSFAAIQSDHFYITDTSPSHFCVVFQAQHDDRPEITIYSDSEGTQNITSQLDIQYYPVQGEITDDLIENDIQMTITEKALALGIFKLGIYNCQPETSYYFKITLESGTGNLFMEPLEGTHQVTTPSTNSFATHSEQLLIKLESKDSTLDTTGWLVKAGSDFAQFPITSFFGDGALSNEAFLNLSHFFSLDAENSFDEPTYSVDLTIWGYKNGSIQQAATVNVSEQFGIISMIPLSINDLPRISSVSDLFIYEDSEPVSFPLTITDFEMETNELTITCLSSNQDAFPDDQIIVNITNTHQSISIVPTPQQNGKVDLTIHVSDGTHEVTSQFSVYITPVADTPVLEMDQLISGKEDQSI
ncbi:MAG: hypothetical protein OMM_06637, partial [Candidatus Magnetoglobus multicellularis str. Araruama]